MKYVKRVVKNKKPKEPVENQEDLPKRRGGRPKGYPDATPKKHKKVYDLEYQKNNTKKNMKCDVQYDVCRRQISKTNLSEHKKTQVLFIIQE